MGYRKRAKSFSEKQEDYKRFRNSLKINFDDIDIKSKEQLKKLMRVGGYRRLQNKTTREWQNIHPSQKQLDFSWNYLKSIGKVTVEERFVKPLAKEKPRRKVRRKKRITIRKVSGISYIFKDEKQYKKIPKNVDIITPKGFKKKQIRDSKTGRIIGWI